MTDAEYSATFVDKLADLCTGWVLAAASIALGVIVPLYASLLGADKIFLAPVSSERETVVAWPSIIFWLLFLLLVGSASLLEWSRRHVNRLTAAPPGFFGEYDANFALAHRAAAEIFHTRSATLEQTENCIRIVLDAIVNLACRFDARPTGVTYAANIMLYRPLDTFPHDDFDSLRRRLHFVEPGIDIHSLKGVLDLQTELSTSTRRQGSKPDDALLPLALPIPQELRSPDNRRWRILPGAPYAAFADRTISAYANTRTLLEWCRTQGDFSPTVLEEIRDYFDSEAGQRIKSFFCLTLQYAESNLPTGVLNLHRDQEGLLDRPSSLRLFVPLMTPFNSLLLELLRIREWKRGIRPLAT